MVSLCLATLASTFFVPFTAGPISFWGSVTSLMKGDAVWNTKSAPCIQRYKVRSGKSEVIGSISGSCVLDIELGAEVQNRDHVT